MSTRYVTKRDCPDWLELRCALWPEGSRDKHLEEIESFLGGTAREPQAVILAERDGRVVGLAELSIRPHAEGCSSGRVAFLEGWYVVPEFRRLNVGRELVAAAEQWAIGQGCSEFGSDTQIDNEVSAAAHRNCGFVEVGTIRCFRKELPNNAPQATREDLRA